MCVVTIVYWRPYCVGYVLASYLFSDHLCLISSWGLVTMWSPRAQLWWFCSSTTITTVCGQLYCMVTIGFTNQLWSCEKHITTFKIKMRICFFYETNSHNNSCSYLNGGGYVAPPWWQSWFSVFINLILGYGHIGHNVVEIESTTQLWWFCCNTCLHAGL